MKELPPNFHVPDVAYTPEMKYRIDRLSAMAKGHLTRRLLQTERVQRVIRYHRIKILIILELAKSVLCIRHKILVLYFLGFIILIFAHFNLLKTVY